jgi:Bacterial regulatory proteins, luxR family
MEGRRAHGHAYLGLNDGDPKRPQLARSIVDATESRLRRQRSRTPPHFEAAPARVGSELHASLNTVKTHVVHVLRRLGVTDRTQAAVLASQLGILDESSS